ncbi:frizzled 9 [Trichuris trichiura]|uniref:Frizzled 9 n=1 Tax=Trichuris trichiura TaxID=36087 RepID=A0A077Z9D7_TRITR|nr:frizzled 9 [Trichuris trichiura]
MLLSMLLLLLFLLGLMVKGSDWAPALCERISVPVCRDMPYNFTRLPNLIGDQDQQSVAMSMHDFEPLIDIKCSVNLKFFLCSVFTPMCTEAMDEPITSCRSVCQEVERSCAPPLANFGIQWPSVLNCSQFPVQNSEPPCMDPSPAKGLSNRNHRQHDRPSSSSRGATTTVRSRQPIPVSRYELATPTDGCGTQFAMIDRHDLHNKCVLKCNEHWMFSGEQKRFVKIWMAAWASLCLLATGLTLVTFLLDGYRFAYPKRPVVFIALCHFMYSIAYLLPIIAGVERASCQRLTSGYSVLVAHSLSNVWCVATFILRYYFALTSVVWWLILTMTWYLAAGRKWSQEAIARHSSMFHILAWALPAGLTVIVMVTHEVEANELTSLCFICSQSNSALYGFFVGPIALLSAVGVGFMIAGVRSMVRIRKDMRYRACDTELQKLRQLMTKICVFSLLYFVTTLVVLICVAYERVFVDNLWRNSASGCPHHQRGNGGDKYCEGRLNVAADNIPVHRRPVVEVYMLNIAMSMTVGIVSCLWVWSKKTVQTWQRFLCRSLLPAAVASKPVHYAPVLSRRPEAPSSQQLSTGCYHFSLNRTPSKP